MVKAVYLEQSLVETGLFIKKWTMGDGERAGRQWGAAEGTRKIASTVCGRIN